MPEPLLNLFLDHLASFHFLERRSDSFRNARCASPDEGSCRPGGSITKAIGGVPVFLFRECSSNRLYKFTWLNNARSLSEVLRRGCPREHGDVVAGAVSIEPFEGSRWRGAPCRSGYGFSIAYWGRIGRGSMLGHVASRDRICRRKAVWVRNGEGNRVRVMIIRVCEHTKGDSLIRRLRAVNEVDLAAVLRQDL